MNVDFPETLCRNPRMDAVRNHLARNGQLVHPGPCVFFEFACDPGQIPWILEPPRAYKIPAMRWAQSKNALLQSNG